MRLREPATRVHVRLEPLVAVWEVPLTGRPCISQQTACEGAMTTTNCVNTGSEAHDPANAAFEEAASQLEEQG